MKTQRILMSSNNDSHYLTTAHYINNDGKLPAAEDSKFSPLDAFFFLLDLHDKNSVFR